MSNKVSLTITRGDDRTWNVAIKDSQGNPVDITTATYSASIRKEYNSTVIGNPTVTVTDAADGRLELNIPSALSSLLTVRSGKRNSSYVFDLVQELNGESTTYLNGYLIVEERVTPVGP